VVARALWVVRHAPVAVRGVCYGQSDVPLEVDHAHAADRVLPQLGAAGLRPVMWVWTSPAERTRGLAEAIGQRLGARVEVDPRLAEIAFGAWEGRAYAEIEANDGARFTAWMNDWNRAAPPGGERVADLVARLEDWRQARAASDEVGIAITHAGPIRALRALLRGVEYAVVASEVVEWLRLERLA
jgi:alpha-ribazole phosphatase